MFTVYSTSTHVAEGRVRVCAMNTFYRTEVYGSNIHFEHLPQCMGFVVSRGVGVMNSKQTSLAL